MAVLVQGPELGMELTFPQERQRGHPATQLLLFGAKQLEILEEFANPQEAHPQPFPIPVWQTVTLKLLPSVHTNLFLSCVGRFGLSEVPRYSAIG